MNKEILDRKYAQLLLNNCLSFNNTDSLVIEYKTHEHFEFINIIIEEALKMKINNIEVICIDQDEKHDYLKNTKLEDIKLNRILDRSYLDRAAKINGCVLHIFTSIPNLMDDINPDIMAKANLITRESMGSYRVNNTKYKFPWVIAAYPNQRWADFLFPNDPNAYDRLYESIIKACMVDKDEPLVAWNNYKIANNKYKDFLNSLGIKKLYYKNSLGTDFEIGLPEEYEWLNMDKTDQFGSSIMVNMPSYEIFTAPDYRTANGIVYNSKPLIINNNIIDNFYLEFEKGRVVNYKAEIGHKYLKGFLDNNKNADRLGEVALVNYDSPISNMNTIFYETLFDENASCHLALGSAHLGPVKSYQNMSDEELEAHGINVAEPHEDFMIGTEDLEITADTNQGKQYIFKKGNFI